MSEYFFKSSDVKTYPSGFRSEDVNSKLTTEENLILQSFGQNDFLIPDPRNNNEGYYLVRIHGYLFAFNTSSKIQQATAGENLADYRLGIRLSNLATNSNSSGSVSYGNFLSNIVANSGNNDDLRTLDNDGYFYGLCLYNSTSNINITHSIPLEKITINTSNNESTIEIDPSSFFSDIKPKSNINIESGNYGDINIITAKNLNETIAGDKVSNAIGNISINSSERIYLDSKDNTSLDLTENASLNASNIFINSNGDAKVEVGNNSSLKLDTQTNNNNSSINIGHINTSNILNDSTKEIKIESRENNIKSSENTSIIAGEELRLHADDNLSINTEKSLTLDVGEVEDISIGHWDNTHFVDTLEGYNENCIYESDTLVKDSDQYFLCKAYNNYLDPKALVNTDYWEQKNIPEEFNPETTYTIGQLVYEDTESGSDTVRLYYIITDNTPGAIVKALLSTSARLHEAPSNISLLSDNLEIQSINLDITSHNDIELKTLNFNVDSKNITLLSNNSSGNSSINISDLDGNISLESTRGNINLVGNNGVTINNNTSISNDGLILTVGNISLNDSPYEQLDSSAQFDSNQTYYILSEGSYIVDTDVNANNFTEKVLTGLFIQAEDKIVVTNVYTSNISNVSKIAGNSNQTDINGNILKSNEVDTTTVKVDAISNNSSNSDLLISSATNKDVKINTNTVFNSSGNVASIGLVKIDGTTEGNTVVNANTFNGNLSGDVEGDVEGNISGTYGCFSSYVATPIINNSGSVTINTNTSVSEDGNTLRVGNVTVGKNSISFKSNDDSPLTIWIQGDRLSIGNTSSIPGIDAVQIGTASKTTARAVAIGNNANASTGDGDSIAIGNNANAGAGGFYCRAPIAIGNNASAGGQVAESPIAIGNNAHATGSYAIQLGNGSNTNTSTLQFMDKTIVENDSTYGHIIRADRIGSSAIGDESTPVYVGSDGVVKVSNINITIPKSTAFSYSFNQPSNIQQSGFYACTLNKDYVNQDTYILTIDSNLNKNVSSEDAFIMPIGSIANKVVTAFGYESISNRKYDGGKNFSGVFGVSGMVGYWNNSSLLEWMGTSGNFYWSQINNSSFVEPGPAALSSDGNLEDYTVQFKCIFGSTSYVKDISVHCSIILKNLSKASN